MKKITIGFLLMIFFPALAYSGVWFFMQQKMERSINQFYLASGPAMGFKFYGPRPQISGFPGQPVIIYKKGYSVNGLNFSFKEIHAKGFPLPHFPFTLEIADKGVIWKKDLKERIFFNDFSLIFTLPKSFPESSLQYHIEQWQKNIGNLNIKKIDLKTQKTHILATGILGLDQSLQPTCRFDTQVEGYEEAVNFFVSTGALKPLPGALVLSALNAMAQTNPETGEKFAQFDTVIKDQNLSAGPIKIGKIPFIQWR